MSRDHRRQSVLKTMEFTGGRYQQIRQAIDKAGPRLQDAQDAGQQRAESALMRRLLHGAQALVPDIVSARFPLLACEAYPAADGLRLVVPDEHVAAFATALAMAHAPAGSRPPADDISIRRGSAHAVHLTAADAPAASIVLKCHWNALRAAITDDPEVWSPSAAELRLSTPGPEPLAPDERAVLSGLLRRHALFNKPDCFQWLLRLHRWMSDGRHGRRPLPPDGLAASLRDDICGLLPAQLHTLGVGHPSSPPPAHDRLDAPARSAPLTAQQNSRAISPTGALPTTQTRNTDGRTTKTNSRYGELAVTVFRLVPEHPFSHDFFLLRFPERWTAPLGDLTSSGRRQVRKQPLSLVSLNDVITALVPSCVVAAGTRTDSADQAWLIAYEPVDPRTIFELVAAWVRAQDASPELIELTLAQLSPDDLVCTPVRITPDLPFTLLSRLVPMAIAAELSRPDASTAPGELRFVRCPTSTGAELVSTPPRQFDDHMSFSARIGITVQTTPASEELLVYLSFGVRRWVGKRPRLTIGRDHTVFLRSGSAHAPHLRSAKITLEQIPQEGKRNHWRAVWSGGLGKVLRHTRLFGDLPDAEHLVATPAEYMGPDDVALLAYTPGMHSWPRVSNDLGAVERAGLLAWATDELTPHLQPVVPLPRVPHTVYNGHLTEVTPILTPAALHNAVGPRLTLELFTGFKSNTQHVLDRLEQRLGVPLPRADELSETETLLQFGPVVIGIRCLPTPSATPAKEFARLLNKMAHPVIAVADAAGVDRQRDRRALRRVLTRAGRLAQLVNPVESDNARHSRDQNRLNDRNGARFGNAVDRLLRCAGMRPASLPGTVAGTVTKNPTLLAVWMLRQPGRDPHNSVPIAIRTEPDGRQVAVRTPDSSWEPLHIGLLTICAQLGDKGGSYGSRDKADFIEEVVNHTVSTHASSLLLTYAQNIRQALPSLRNNKLTADVVDFGIGAPRASTSLRGFRHVHVRTATGSETPQCYALGGDRIGHAAGLWQFLDPRLFGSTAGKPAIHADKLTNVSKFSTITTHDGKPHAPSPRKEVWNPRFVELFVNAIQDGDQPEHWAALAHQLRDAAPLCSWTTELPWPLELCRQVEEHLADSWR